MNSLLHASTYTGSEPRGEVLTVETLRKLMDTFPEPQAMLLIPHGSEFVMHKLPKSEATKFLMDRLEVGEYRRKK